MVLDVNKLSVLVHPLERVASIAVVVAPAVGSTVIAEEHYARMIGFRSQGEQIEEGVIIQKKVLGITVLRADHVGALDRITAEENGPVETDDVVVTFAGVELDGETAGVARRVGKLTAEGDGGEAHEDGGLDAFAL